MSVGRAKSDGMFSSDRRPERTHRVSPMTNDLVRPSVVLLCVMPLNESARSSASRPARQPILHRRSRCHGERLAARSRSTYEQGHRRIFRSRSRLGVLDSEALPAGALAWVHYSVIEFHGFRELAAGETVLSDFERADQDGYRATRVIRSAGAGGAGSVSGGARHEEEGGGQGESTHAGH